MARADSGNLARPSPWPSRRWRWSLPWVTAIAEPALRNNLADLSLHAADRGEEAMAQLKQAVVIFAEIGVGAGDAQPEIWKLTE